VAKQHFASPATAHFHHITEGGFLTLYRAAGDTAAFLASAALGKLGDRRSRS
jgi:hypothetical protein